MVDPRGESDTPPCGNHNDIIGEFPTSTVGGGGTMQSFTLPGVFSGIIGLVPVAFHLAGVQRLSHLAQSPHDPFPGNHLHTSIPLTGLERDQYTKQ